MTDDIRDEFDPPITFVEIAARKKRDLNRANASSLKKRHLAKRQAWLKDNPTVGNWTILGMAANVGHRSMIRCKCICGAEHDVLLASLKSGASTQCNKCARSKGRGKG